MVQHDQRVIGYNVSNDIVSHLVVVAARVEEAVVRGRGTDNRSRGRDADAGGGEQGGDSRCNDGPAMGVGVMTVDEALQ